MLTNVFQSHPILRTLSWELDLSPFNGGWMGTKAKLSKYNNFSSHIPFSEKSSLAPATSTESDQFLASFPSSS